MKCVFFGVVRVQAKVQGLNEHSSITDLRNDGKEGHRLGTDD